MTNGAERRRGRGRGPSRARPRALSQEEPQDHEQQEAVQAVVDLRGVQVDAAHARAERRCPPTDGKLDGPRQIRRGLAVVLAREERGPAADEDGEGTRPAPGCRGRPSPSGRRGAAGTTASQKQADDQPAVEDEAALPDVEEGQRLLAELVVVDEGVEQTRADEAEEEQPEADVEDPLLVELQARRARGGAT